TPLIVWGKHQRNHFGPGASAPKDRLQPALDEPVAAEMHTSTTEGDMRIGECAPDRVADPALVEPAGHPSSCCPPDNRRRRSRRVPSDNGAVSCPAATSTRWLRNSAWS